MYLVTYVFGICNEYIKNKGEFIMKKFENASIEELNITETANGLFNFDWESPLNILSNKKNPSPEVTPSNPTTPSEPAPEVSHS